MHTTKPKTPKASVATATRVAKGGGLQRSMNMPKAIINRPPRKGFTGPGREYGSACLLYTSDAADE